MPSGSQIGIFEGGGPIHEKVAQNYLTKKIKPLNTVCQIHTDIVALKAHYSTSHPLSR